MLSCHDVLEALPAIETGEATTGDVRDHLATCRSCRAEAEAVRAGLDGLRRELAALAPTPFLEDAALEAARSAPVASGPQRRALWLPAGIAMAAAVVLVAILVLAKLPTDEATAPGAEDTDPSGPSLVAYAPTAAQVAKERAARQARASETYTTQFYRLPGAPMPGVAMIGQVLLTEIGKKHGGMLHKRAQAAFLQLTNNGRDRFVTLQLGSPGGGGTACKIRALVNPQYAGSVLIEEPLARALGLHEHELPRTITIGGDTSMRAAAARGHVRVGSFTGDADIEVVLEGGTMPAVPLTGGGVPQALRLVIRGERPDSGFAGNATRLHHAHGRAFVVADKTMSWKNRPDVDPEIGIESQGPLKAALSFHAGTYPECLVFLPSLDMGGGGTLAWAVRMERVALSQKFEPRAQVTIARVWRGRTAIPSRESVAHTRADKDGLVSFVHQRGERGPLRAREVRSDGSVRWHDLVLPGDSTAQRKDVAFVRVLPDGRVALRGVEYAPWTKNARGVPMQPHQEAETKLRHALSKVASAGGRDAEGASKVTLWLLASKTTPWHIVERVMMACAHPDVKLAKLKFGIDRSKAPATAYEMPRDRGLDAPPLEAQTFTVRLVWKGDELRYRAKGDIPSIEGPCDSSLRGFPMLDAVIRLAKGALAKGYVLHGKLHPVGGVTKDIPYEVVRGLIARMQASGVDQVLILNTPPRRR